MDLNCSLQTTSYLAEQGSEGEPLLPAGSRGESVVETALSPLLCQSSTLEKPSYTLGVRSSHIPDTVLEIS